MTLWKYLKLNMLTHLTQVISENGAEMNFESLLIWAENFSNKLKNFKCCAILCSSEMASAMALLACFAAEVTALPLSMRYGTTHCNRILDAISPDAIITDVSGDFEILTITGSTYTAPEEHPALIMCTSGTTGKPKGAMLSESNIISNVKDIASYFAIDKRDRILICRPLYHCAVLTGEFLTSLVKGVKIRFYSDVFNPNKIFGLIRDFKITAFCATPTLIGIMSKLQKHSDNKTLKHIVISGECMGRELGLEIAAAFPQSDIYHVYGLTEASPRVAYLPPELFREHPEFVGGPVKSASIRIIKENGEACKVNEEGILWVKGDSVMLGYYRDPQRTAEVLSNGWLCTGDIAVINEKGLLRVKGRKDNLIIKSGMNIYPAEVEGAMMQDKRVKEVLVYGFENRFGTQIGMKISGDFSSVNEVKKTCRKLLPSFQIPSLIEIVPKILRNGSGKIIRPTKARTKN